MGFMNIPISKAGLNIAEIPNVRLPAHCAALRTEHDPIAKNSRNLGEDFRKFSAKTNEKN